MNVINKLKLGGETYNVGLSDGSIIPISQGGTGADNYKDALANLHAVETVTETLTYYVNATNGNDDNDGLTEGTAFKTIQYAINCIPKILSHDVYIYLAKGTYNEDVRIQYFSGGSIRLLGAYQDNSSSNNLANSVNYKIKSVTCANSLTRIQCKGLEIYGSRDNDGTSIYIGWVPFASVECCRMTSSSKTGIYVAYTKLYITASFISNKEFAITGQYPTYIYCVTLTGENNQVAFNSTYGSTIHYSNTQTSVATTMYQRAYSGVIFDANGDLI